MRTQWMVSVGLMVSFTAAACGSSSGDASVVNGDDQDVTSGRALLKGSWVRQGDEGDANEAIELRPDGTFFRDATRILNGAFVTGSVPTTLVRDTGAFTVHASTNTLTLH